MIILDLYKKGICTKIQLNCVLKDKLENLLYCSDKDQYLGIIEAHTVAE